MSLQEDSKSVVLIDEHNLDKECIRLPSDYLKWAHLAANAKRDADEVKNKVEVIEAELLLEIRSNPEHFKIDKVTEGAIKATLVTLPRYQKAQQKLAEAKHVHDMTQAVVWALEHKKRTLTLLVELHGMSYFSEPKVSEKGRHAVEQMTQSKVRRRLDRD